MATGELSLQNVPTVRKAFPFHGPPTRYVKLLVTHAPGTFFPPPTSKQTAG